VEEGPMTVPIVDALAFDVFGTVVDWRSGVIRDGKRKGYCSRLGSVRRRVT
jgi:2-haloacid dehalogenase